MKKFLGLLVLLLIMGCDDGDMSFDTFDFGDAALQECGADSNVLYKINQSQVLIAEIDPSNFINAIAEREVTIGSANTVVYRNYNAVVTNSSGVICTDVPAATPTVIEEWDATGGTMKIVSRVDIDDDGVITGYSHDITFTNVTFVKDNGDTVVMTDVFFGTYNTDLGYSFEFITYSNGEPISIESCNGLVYKRNNNESLIIDLADNNAYANIVGSDTYQIDGSTNRVVFDVYNGTVTPDNICASIPPVTPIVTQRWNSTGEVTIVTTFNATLNKYEHNITMNLTFVNSAVSQEEFEITDYPFGIHTTNP